MIYSTICLMGCQQGCTFHSSSITVSLKGMSLMGENEKGGPHPAILPSHLGDTTTIGFTIQRLLFSLATKEEASQTFSVLQGEPTHFLIRKKICNAYDCLHAFLQMYALMIYSHHHDITFFTKNIVNQIHELFFKCDEIKNRKLISRNFFILEFSNRSTLSFNFFEIVHNSNA